MSVPCIPMVPLPSGFANRRIASDFHQYDEFRGGYRAGAFCGSGFPSFGELQKGERGEM